MTSPPPPLLLLLLHSADYLQASVYHYSLYTGPDTAASRLYAGSRNLNCCEKKHAKIIRTKENTMMPTTRYDNECAHCAQKLTDNLPAPNQQKYNNNKRLSALIQRYNAILLHDCFVKEEEE